MQPSSPRDLQHTAAIVKIRPTAQLPVVNLQPKQNVIIATQNINSERPYII